MENQELKSTLRGHGQVRSVLVTGCGRRGRRCVDEIEQSTRRSDGRICDCFEGQVYRDDHQRHCVKVIGDERGSEPTADCVETDTDWEQENCCDGVHPCQGGDCRRGPQEHIDDCNQIVSKAEENIDTVGRRPVSRLDQFERCVSMRSFELGLNG